jgi:PhzF family phenazine biosynthesis protein
VTVGAAAPPTPAPGGRIRLFWVDALGDAPFTGNPAAVCLLGAPAPAAAMQALATELGISETAFVWREADDFSLRWFTPAVEVDLCGHATVAAAHALARAGWAAGTGTVRFRTRSGLVPASVEGETVEIDMPADVPSEGAAHRGAADLESLWPVVATAVGRTDVVVELASEADVRAVRAEEPGLLDAIGAMRCRGVIATAPADAGSGAHYVLRFFAPGAGVAEDPVTGSAQCVLAPYWAKRLGREDFVVAQRSARGGTLHVRLVDDRVLVRGRASTIFSGELTTSTAAAFLAGARGTSQVHA